MPHMLGIDPHVAVPRDRPVFDVVCPWCFIGSRRLEQALVGLADELDAEVCYHPFFLDPNLPKQGVSLPEKLRRKYGVDPKRRNPVTLAG